MLDLRRGIRPLDVVLTLLLAGLGVVLGVVDAAGVDPSTVADPSSWLVVPVFVLAAVPVLWWRRAPVLAVGCAAAVMALHDVLFGQVARCGFGLPLAFVLAFLVGLARPWRTGLVGLALSIVLAVAVLVWDTAAGPEPLPVVVVLIVALWGIGQVTRSRAAIVAALGRQNEELAALREKRAALEVAEERLRVSRRLETVIADRLTDLEIAAEAGRASADPERTRAVLAAVEEGGRRTLDEMRATVGVLRGDDTPPAPTPSLAHLQALLAGRGVLTVVGEPRVLSTGQELSVHRICEHLVSVLDEPAVAVRFRPDTVEVEVAGAPARGADLRGSLARVRERVRVHQGSADADVGRGLVHARAVVPLLDG